MKIRLILKLVILSVGVFFISSCAFLPGVGLFQKRYSPLPEDLLYPIKPEEMLTILRQRAPEITTLWANAKVKIKGKTKKESGYFRATFLYLPPEKARLRGYRTGLPTLFEILVVNNTLFFHLNQEKRLYIGSIEEWRDSPVIFSDVDLRDVGLLLEPLQIYRSVLEYGEHKIDDTDKRFYTITVPHLPHKYQMASSPMQLLVRKKDLLVQGIRVYSPEKRLRAEIFYNRYDIFEAGTVLPTKVLLKVYDRETKIFLNDIHYKINREFSEKVFEPPSYKGIKRLPLRMLWEEKGSEQAD